MSDFEGRLTAALGAGAEDAPTADGLALAARARARTRRRTTRVVVAVAVAVVLAGVTGIGLGVRSGHDQAVAPASTVAGWRTESYRGLTLEVPDVWPDVPAARCVNAPTVRRPGVDQARCLGAPGVSFVDRASGPGIAPQAPRLVDGGWVGVVVGDGVSVVVQADSRSLDEQILATAHMVVDLDANRCPRYAFVDARVNGPASQMSVCRYGGGELVQSELLSPRDTRSAVDALKEAPRVPIKRYYSMSGTLSEVVDLDRVLLYVHDRRIAIDLQPVGRLAVAHLVERRATPQLLYWALSPGWSGTVGKGVTLPDPLRTN